MVKGIKYSPQTGLIHRSRGKGVTKCVTRGSYDKDGYTRIEHIKKTYKVHRLAFYFMGKEIPKDMNVDHINGKRDDNRWTNLRLVSVRDNNLNKPCHRSGHLPGTTFVRGKWQSQIYMNKKKKHLGYFKTNIEAHEAYMKVKNG